MSGAGVTSLENEHEKSADASSSHNASTCARVEIATSAASLLESTDNKARKPAEWCFLTTVLNPINTNVHTPLHGILLSQHLFSDKPQTSLWNKASQAHPRTDSTQPGNTPVLITITAQLHPPKKLNLMYFTPFESFSFARGLSAQPSPEGLIGTA
ncbi:hypothetical protein BDP27DRAFT_1434567 [Rhodocollybia butyracea]|uniref:Uncharacterized protein n=1 Tax=Rhodocollybia butyracea TaxID=206335 RepID=A0A9P5P8H3_9AGAR|nr:hypothetical protein BDP27DRAFT_1434567 [Rhodocollybia butyracea]